MKDDTSTAADEVPADDSAKPLVSVVVPTCNRCGLMERCLDALAAQTHDNFEVIVVDDCSTDDTPEMLERFAREHPGFALRTLRNESHAGANPSRNRGIQAARGRFVAFLDSDCIAEPDWLEKLMAGFTSDNVAAVIGRVDDPKPANIYELTFKGTHRLPDRRHANRLVAGNMCLRRDLLLKYALDEDRASQPVTADGQPDVSVSGRGDEEGLYLFLSAAGYEQIIAPDAVVFHEHHYNRRSFFRQAWRGGQSAARLVYKYYLPQRIDMLPFILAYVTLPLMLINARLGLISAAFFAVALAAITYNDLFRKRKTLGETILSFPILVAYYHVRLAGYVTESIRLRIAKHGVKRERIKNT